MKCRWLIALLAPTLLVLACAQPGPGITTSSPEPGSAPTSGRLDETPTATPFGEAVTDAGITIRVKTTLLADPDVSGVRIDVDTRDRIVTLTGIVNTAAEKTRALEQAAKVENVTRVEDRLTVHRR